MPTPNSHALLSPSSAHRWLKCTAAPLFEQNFPSGTSAYAEEGTLAHSVCELYARKKFTVMSTRKFNSELKKLKEDPRFAEEMIHTAEAYVEYLTEKAMGYTNMPYVAMEVRVDLSEYLPHGSGTCDCIMIGGDTLHITDYKHGKGVKVEAKDNPQMRLYALGALAAYRPIFGDTIKNVSMGICQPRLSSMASEDLLTVDELLAWGESIKLIAQDAYNGPGTFRPGDHCRFCRGKSQCRARAEKYSAFADFKDFIPAGKVPAEQAALPAEARPILGLPPILSDDEIGDLLIQAESLVQWYKDLQAYATEALLAGRSVPGWKVVAGRSDRAFKDTDAAFQVLRDQGYDEALLYERKPLTLTKIEALMGKKKFAEIMAEHVTKPLGKPTLALASDKREAYSTATTDFAGVING